MEMMNKVFRQYFHMLVIVFIDDIFIYFKIASEHMNHLRMMLQVLKDQRFYANFSKCEFWVRSVTFL